VAYRHKKMIILPIGIGGTGVKGHNMMK